MRLLALALMTATAAMTGTGGTAASAAPRAQNWNRGTPITITVTNDRFTPSTLTLRRGAHYVLNIRNRSNRRHNFSAPEFFALARVAPRDARWVSDNRVDLRAGQSARLHIIAPDTPRAVYRFRSTNLLDATEKLRGEILVR